MKFYWQSYTKKHDNILPFCFIGFTKCLIYYICNVFNYHIFIFRQFTYDVVFVFVFVISQIYRNIRYTLSAIPVH